MTSTMPEKPFRFLDLPPELKNRIYSLLLEDNTAEELRPQYHTPAPNNIHPNILSTCREINAEATGILYANNVFAGRGESSVKYIMLSIGDSVKHLRHVEIFEGISIKVHFKPILLMLKSAKWLKTFKIGGVRFRYDTPEKLAKEIGPLIRALHKARKKEKEYTMKSVLHVLVVHKFGRHFMQTEEEFQAKYKDVNDEYEKEVKELIAATLK